MFTYIKNTYLWHKIKKATLLTGDEDNYIFKSRLKKKHKWTEEKCDDLLSQYKQFLFIAATSNEKETPTQEVDEVWHEHILFTQDYFDDWTKILGKTIHHAPDRVVDEAATKKVFTKTQSKLDALQIKLQTRAAELKNKPQLKQATSKRTSDYAHSYSGDSGVADALILNSLISSCSSHSSSPSESLPAEAPPSTSHCSSSSSHCSSRSSSGSSCSSSSCSSGSSCGSGGD